MTLSSTLAAPSSSGRVTQLPPNSSHSFESARRALRWRWAMRQAPTKKSKSLAGEVGVLFCVFMSTSLKANQGIFRPDSFLLRQPFGGPVQDPHHHRDRVGDHFFGDRFAYR